MKKVRIRFSLALFNHRIIYFFGLFFLCCFSLIGQDTETEKMMDRPGHNSVSLKKALKEPLKAKKIFITSYRDTVFPTNELMQFVNAEQFVLSGNYGIVNDTFRFHTLYIDTVKLKQFKNLVRLSFVEFDFSKHFPEGLFSFRQLKGLSLSMCNLDDLPDGISRLQELTYLELRINNLTQLPDEVFRLPKLEVLDLCNNNFTTLPLGLPRLHKLRKLSLTNVESKKPRNDYIVKIHINTIDFRDQYLLLREILSGPSHPIVEFSLQHCDHGFELEEQLRKDGLLSAVTILWIGCKF